MNEIFERFYDTVIADEYWLMLLRGLGATVIIAVFATIIGIVLGFLVAIIRATHEMNLAGRKCRRFGDYILKVVDKICAVYITVIRGTPMLVQLMIMYYIIFKSSRNGMLAAIFSFGINSGAYVAEIVRGGIMSIDKGQFEASRSLGFDYKSTMFHIILPQAFKTVLPALGNEFIVLFKETSVAGYVAIMELTYMANLIISRTYDAFFPLIIVALVYLTFVLILSFFLKKLERRLSSRDH